MAEWHSQGRPPHADFTALSLAALTSDAEAVDGNARPYAEQATGMNMRILAARARSEAEQVLDVAVEEGLDPETHEGRFRTALAAWGTGLNAGLSRSRGISLTDDQAVPPAAELDAESVSYMARGRMTTLFDREGDKGLLELCAAAWFDGCIIGATFDDQRRNATT